MHRQTLTTKKLSVRSKILATVIMMMMARSHQTQRSSVDLPSSSTAWRFHQMPPTLAYKTIQITIMRVLLFKSNSTEILSTHARRVDSGRIRAVRAFLMSATHKVFRFITAGITKSVTYLKRTIGMESPSTASQGRR